MYAANVIDVGDQLEVVGFHVPKNKPGKRITHSHQLGMSQTEEWETAFLEKQLQAKEEENRKRAERRSKTKIRRTCRKYKLQYMWTLTIADPQTKIVNPTNGTITHVDAGDISQVWDLWKLFLHRCRKAGLYFNYIVTVELQEKRLADHGQRVYHFHFATDSWIPQNEFLAIKNKTEHYLEKYWTFGFCKATEKRSNGKVKNAAVYLVKYISKNFDGSMKGRQRYRIKEGLIIPKHRVMNIKPNELKDFAEGHGKIILIRQIEQDAGPPIQWILLQKWESVPA